MLKWGTQASPAIARAGFSAGRRGASQEDAFGDAAAQPGELLGILEEIEDRPTTAYLASSMPATSLKMMLMVDSVMRRTQLLPRHGVAPPPDCIWRMKKIRMFHPGPVRRAARRPAR